jgi:glycosyltransferase involved in cell wall biosynthesis
MRRMARAIVVYTEAQAMELGQRMPATRIIAAPNALYRREEIVHTELQTPRSFLYVGRLVEAKRPLILIEAFLAALQNLPSDVELVIVGDGPLRPALEALVGSVGRVRFVGHVGERAELAVLYAHAIASVSPGYVGLAVTQSFSFGVPMLISRDEAHSPEIEAAKEGFNAIFFDGSSSALSHLLVSVATRSDQWAAPRVAISEDCAARYCVEKMVAGIEQAVNYV